MVTLLQKIIFWYASLHDFHKQDCTPIQLQFNDPIWLRKGVPESRTINTFDFENSRSNVKCCDHWEERKTDKRKYVR